MSRGPRKGILSRFRLPDAWRPAFGWPAVVAATAVVAVSGVALLVRPPGVVEKGAGSSDAALLRPAEATGRQSDLALAQERAAGQAQVGALAGAPQAALAARASQASQGSAPAQAAQAGVGGLTPLPPLPVADRMIVKSGSLTLQVGDLAEAMRRVGDVVGGIPGAYVAASSTSYRGEPAVPAAAPPGVVLPPVVPGGPGQSASLTLKVPAGDFGPAMERLRALGTPFQEQVTTQEVTEEYVDLEAQVRSLETVEAQYLRLLERAQRVEEILPLQQRVTEVRTQIDRLRGRMNLLQRRADLSTISVSLVLPGRLGDPGSALEPRPVRTLRLALVGLGTALQGLLDVAIYLGVYLLPLLPVGVAVVWWRRSRRPEPPAATAGA